MVLLGLLALAALLPLTARADKVPGEGDITLSTRFWIDSSGSATVDQVAAESPGTWEAMDHYRSFELGSSALWVRIEPGQLDSRRRWYLMLTAAAFTNDARLYTRGADGGWTEQRAGDHLPVAQWSHPDQTPVFSVDPLLTEPLWLRLANAPAPTSPPAAADRREPAVQALHHLPVHRRLPRVRAAGAVPGLGPRPALW